MTGEVIDLLSALNAQIAAKEARRDRLLAEIAAIRAETERLRGEIEQRRKEGISN